MVISTLKLNKILFILSKNYDQQFKSITMEEKIIKYFINVLLRLILSILSFSNRLI